MSKRRKALLPLTHLHMLFSLNALFHFPYVLWALYMSQKIPSYWPVMPMA